MAKRRCPSCGGDCEFSYEKGYVCRFCGYSLGMDEMGESDAEKLDLASAKRIEDYDFDGSLRLCEEILINSPDSAAANWCALLAENKIVYLKNDEGKYTPTFLDPENGKSLTESRYYDKLDVMRKRNADAIEDMRRFVVRESRKIPDYDIFISYRQHAGGGRETEEAVWAEAFYNALTREHGKKLRIFYDKVSLGESNAGWEPHIYAALKSAKFMVVFVSSLDNINSTWVKNEWKRFASYQRTGENKTIAVAGSGVEPSRLPDIALKTVQMIDTADSRWLDRLIDRAVTACDLSADDEEIAQMFELAEAYIQKKDFKGAGKIYDRVIAASPKSAAAYWGRLKCRLKAFDDYDLVKCKKALGDFDDFNNAVRYAEGKEKGHYLTVQKRSLTHDTIGMSRPNYEVYRGTTKTARLIRRIFAAVLACVIVAGAIFGGVTVANIDKYTISYTDDVGTHTLRVKEGEAYKLNEIPSRYGYEFTGLFGAESGGTQYVGANGASLGVYGEGKNIVLFPRFKAKEYTLVLDYGGATVSGARSVKVTYGEGIESLPTDLKLESKTFSGWYTENGGGGKKVCDSFGVLPTVKVTEDFFDLDNADGNIYIYAGFDIAKYSVTFNFGGGVSSETVSVEHGTAIADVTVDKLVNGKAVLSWSTKENDVEKKNIFTGKVTGDMTLYAAELAPIITFDSVGGNEIESIVAREGEKITLPTPTREMYKFIGWISDGKDFKETSMPSDSLTLTAKWQAMIVFDANGGTSVETISLPTGNRLTLPTTERSGYIFAGWYNGNNKYEATSMPAESVELKAKYWKIETMTKVLIDDTTSGVQARSTTPNMDRNRYDLDLTDIYNKGVRSVVLNVNYQSRHNNAKVANQYITYMSWYREKTASDVYKIWGYSEQHSDSVYERYTRSTNIQLSSRILYCCLYTNYQGTWSTDGGFWKDFYVEIEYPDMSTLY